MAFNSIRFLVFFPVVLLLYYVIPGKYKNVWLLICSYFFYGCWNVRYCLLLLICTLLSYFVAIIAEENAENPGFKKKIFIMGVLFLVGMLSAYKYTNFVLQNLSELLGRFGLSELPQLDIVMPVGISFFTFQALGYLIDVYSGKMSAERSFVNYALFVSFFPQLLSGPIGRAGKLLPQYREAKAFSYEKVRDGFLQLLWGFFLKLVISDRAASLVAMVYGDYHSFTGMQIVFATVIYGVQIYCDFYGYSSMAIGAAEMLGIELPENFDTPYLAASVQEFWRRWHMSLSSWLRDYIYFPLGGSRCSKRRHYINILIVFLVSGLWHGAKWSFVAWGLLHGVYQVLGNVFAPYRRRLCEKMAIRTDTSVFLLGRIFVTFVLVDFAWLFFRADGFLNALRMCKRILLELHPLSLMNGRLYELGLDRMNFWLLVYGIGFLLLTDILRYRGVRLRTWFVQQNWLFRELMVVGGILFILVFGIWGNAYNASSFIYFQF